ncbi:MAG: hypothetical protein JXM70_18105 [Pirellulales bacterium]|nr:hypothetical protein [Pirellulales bacterium]
MLGDTLFGTSSFGGANDDGTIWSFNTGTGVFAKWHDFSYEDDGSHPQGGMILDGINVYSTCYVGGANGQGTLWVIPEPSGLMFVLTGLMMLLIGLKRDHSTL